MSLNCDAFFICHTINTLGKHKRGRTNVILSEGFLSILKWNWAKWDWNSNFWKRCVELLFVNIYTFQKNQRFHANFLSAINFAKTNVYHVQTLSKSLCLLATPWVQKLGKWAVSGFRKAYKLVISHFVKARKGNHWCSGLVRCPILLIRT